MTIQIYIHLNKCIGFLASIQPFSLLNGSFLPLEGQQNVYTSLENRKKKTHTQKKENEERQEYFKQNIFTRTMISPLAKKEQKHHKRVQVLQLHNIN